MSKSLFLSLCLLITINMCFSQETIHLWSGKIPNYQETDEVETQENGDILWIENVQEPTLEIYLPTRNKEQKNASEIILDRISAMHDALVETDSTIIYAICEKGWVSGQVSYAKDYREQITVTSKNRKELFAWAPELGTMWRTTADIEPKGDKIMNILDSQEGLAVLSGPDAFNDPDMLEVGNGGLTLSESRAHFSLWCILAAPLILGNDVRHMSNDVLEVITNKELIALNQDKLCKQAEKVYDENDIEIFLKPLKNGDLGLCILNRSAKEQRFETKWKYLEISKNEVLSVRDVWVHKNLDKTNKSLTVSIKSHDTRVFRLGKTNGNILYK